MKTLLVSLSLAGAVALPPLSHAAPSPEPRGATATVEIHETSPGSKSTVARFEAAVTLDRGASVLETTSGDARYEVTLVWTSHRNRGDHPMIDLNLSLERPRQPPSKVRVQALIPRGKRTVVGQLARPNGGKLEVAVTLR